MSARRQTTIFKIRDDLKDGKSEEEIVWSYGVMYSFATVRGYIKIARELLEREAQRKKEEKKEEKTK